MVLTGPRKEESALKKRRLNTAGVSNIFDANDEVMAESVSNQELNGDNKPVNISAASKPQAQGQGTHESTTLIHVVMLRVAGETSARPVPQAAFLSRTKAAAFSLKILTAFCESHYADYAWRGPEQSTRHCISRYTAFDAQTGQQLVTADAIKVSIFDDAEGETSDSYMEQIDVEQREDPVATKLPTGDPGMTRVSDNLFRQAEQLSQSIPEAKNGWREEIDKKVL